MTLFNKSIVQLTITASWPALENVLIASLDVLFDCQFSPEILKELADTLNFSEISDNGSQTALKAIHAITKRFRTRSLELSKEIEFSLHVIAKPLSQLFLKILTSVHHDKILSSTTQSLLLLIKICQSLDVFSSSAFDLNVLMTAFHHILAKQHTNTPYMESAVSI